MAKEFPDRWGVPVRAGSADAVALLDVAIEDLAGLAGDPLADADAVVAADDSLVLGHIYRAYLQLYGTTPAGVAAAGETLKQLDATVVGEREAHHLHAARAWAAGDWKPPPARWSGRCCAIPVTCARAALEHNPRDVWAVHALTHVFEMEGSQQEGITFLTASAPDWSGSFFAVHNWWHRGLFHLELGETDEALALYDSRIRATRSTEWLDVADAAALLWRLALSGADVTDRAAALAADIDGLVTSPVYVFNDWHAVMAFGLAGDHARNELVIAANRHLTAPTNRRAAERAGVDLLEAFGAFADGRPRACGWSSRTADQRTRCAGNALVMRWPAIRLLNSAGYYLHGVRLITPGSLWMSCVYRGGKPATNVRILWI